MMYLTYFYNSECGEPVVKDDGIFKYHLMSGKNETGLLMEIAKEIVENAEFPAEARQARRTHYYLMAFLFADVIWIFTAVMLFIGACCRVKKRLSLLFHIPWFWMTGAICIMDVVAAVHFGVDLLQINDYTSLLKFIGIVNYQNFSHLNSLNNPSYVPAEFTNVLCLLFARFLVIWIFNIVLFSRIMNTAIWAYAGVLDSLKFHKKVRRRVLDSMLNLDTSESRIRMWQMFYNAVENTITLNSNASSKDCISNEAPRKIRIDLYRRISMRSLRLARHKCTRRAQLRRPAGGRRLLLQVPASLPVLPRAGVQDNAQVLQVSSLVSCVAKTSNVLAL